MINEKRDFRVSVVIPSRNRIAYLPRAISSVLNQSFVVQEIIIIDNDSTDETISYVKKKFKKVKVIKENKIGVSHARNLGIKNSSYEWIAFLDSDDEWMPDKINKQFSFLKKVNFKLQLVHTNEIWIKNGLLKNQKKKHLKKGGYIFENCLDICRISPSSVLINKSLFEKFGLFDTKFKICEDYELWLRLSSKIEIGYLNEPLIKKYGGHLGQLSTKYWGVDRYRVKALEKLLINNFLTYDQKIKVLETLLKKINIILLGAVNRRNKRIIKVYSKKKNLWSNYYYKYISKKN